MHYLLFTPRADAAGPRPLLVFLHARGEVGRKRRDLRRVMKHGLPRLAAEGRLPELRPGEPFPFIVVCPQTAQAGDWSNDIARVAGLIEVLRDQGADASRVFATGVSQGAIGTWELAAAAPDLLRAIAPVSWRVPPAARRAGPIPAWVLVGAEDGRLGVKPETVGDELKALRGDDARTKFTCVPGAGHDGGFWNAVYARADLYGWLLDQEGG
jgi:predicted peptidase